MQRWTLIFVSLLGACSRAPQPAPTPAAAVEPSAQPSAAPTAVTPADDRPVIVCFGDSLSAGYGVETGLSYPDFLQKELDAKGYLYRVVNLGISGDTTSGGLSRIQSAVALHPAIAILELGGNDGLRGLPLADTRSNLSQMTQALLDGGSKVVIAGMTLPPNYGPDYIREFEQIFVELAAKQKLPRIRFLLEGVALNPKLMQADGIHATAEGNRLVAANVMRTLMPLLKRPNQ